MMITGKLLVYVGLVVAMIVNAVSIIIVKSHNVGSYEAEGSVALKVLYLESVLIVVLGIIFIAYNVIEATLK